MLSVLIPTKNNHEILVSQLSIFDQLFSQDDAVKFIVLDNSFSVCKEAACICEKKGWVYDNQPGPLSVADNFNRGIEYIKGNNGYSTFIGDDDFITYHALALCQHLHDNNVDVFRPVFENFVYWNGFTSRRGTVTSAFEVRENNSFIQNLHILLKKHVFKKINKFDGPQFNLIPSFYHCIFSNKLVDNFSFGPFAPDSYSAGFIDKLHVNYKVEISSAIIPGSAPRSSSAYTAVKDGYDSFSSHPHTNAFLNDDVLTEIKNLPYRSDYIWFMSFLAGQKDYRNASEISHTDFTMLQNYNINPLLRYYKRFVSLASAGTVHIKKYEKAAFISFLKVG